MFVSIEKRRTVQLSTALIVGITAVIASLAISTLILWIMGYEPVEVFATAFRKTFFQKRGILESIVMLIPIALCSLAVVVAAKVGLWNIGVEGQFYAGASAATGIALAFPNLPAPLLIPLMIVAAAVAAGILCYLSVLPRVYWGISEILTTILLNSVVIYFVFYLVYYAWNDPTTAAVQTPEFVAAAKLPILIPGSRIHWGIAVAAVVVVAVHYLIKRTVFGYELRAVGENMKGARYAGINIKKYFFGAMFLSGCLAGIAGMLEVSGIVHRLQANISNDYGFSAFVIAFISRLSTSAIIITGFIFSGLIVAGFKMQMMGLPDSVIFMLKGLVLLFVLAGEIFTFYKISWHGGSRARAGAGAPLGAHEIIDTAE